MILRRFLAKALIFIFAIVIMDLLFLIGPH